MTAPFPPEATKYAVTDRAYNTAMHLMKKIEKSDSMTRVHPKQSFKQRHCIPTDCRIAMASILSGLHHEYWLEKIASVMQCKN
jgi:hypothetical protein